MIKRTVEISNPGYLKVKFNQLLIEQGEQQASVPFEDLGVLILAHRQITITQAVLQHCAEVNCVVVHCNAQYLPISLTLPLVAHTLQTKAMRLQSSISTVRRKQLWQQIVQAKIREQAETLKRLYKNHKPLQALIKHVKSGDKDNTEAQAAQRYWKLLMHKGFRRNPDLPDSNVQLNYGYAIVRAAIARALVGTGFHPSLGLHHSNQYNAYCLADDVMEPFRPWIDEITAKQQTEQLNQQSKNKYLQLLAQTVLYKQQQTPFMVALSLMAADLKKAYRSADIKLDFPQRLQAQLLW